MALLPRLLFGTALAASLLACGDDGAATPTDGGADAPAFACDASFQFAPGDPTGSPDPLAIAAGQARAGRIRADQLPPDPKGLATFAAGDFVLANARIAALIEDVGASDIYDPWGGKIVGLAKTGGGVLVDAADFEEALVGLSRFTLETSSVGVVADGSDGGPAIVRAVGTLAPLPAIDELTRLILPGAFDGAPAALEYELAPDAEHLDVFLTVGWGRPRYRAPVVVHAFIQANRMQPFAPGAGFALEYEAIPYIGFVQEGGTGYAWRSMDGSLSLLFEDTGFSGLSAPAVQLEGCAETRLHLARVVVGGPGLDGLLEAVAREGGATLRAITGVVTTATGAPAEGVHVHATRTDGAYLTRATTDAAGAFTLHVPSDAGGVQLTAFRRGDGVAGPIDVPAGASEGSLVLPPAGAITVNARSLPEAAPLPVRVQIIPVGGAPEVPRSFGELGPGGGRLHVAYPIDGTVTLPVPAGDHRVIVSHGFDHEVFTQTVSVAAGATVTVDAALDRVVDTTGVMCGDFHIHTHRSLDSADPETTKVASAIADGVEILVRSDHEWIADFQPVIESLGAAAWAMGVESDELSTNLYGHFGVFPLEADESQPNAGAIPWVYTKTPELFARIRARPEQPAIIVNHPRASGGLADNKAYFNYVGYDPATGMVERADYWDESFDAIEIVNDGDFEENREGSVRDWFSFLSRGRRVFAVGSSDSHRVDTNPVGYPRTCIRFGTDDPRAITPAEVRDVLRTGAATISGGIYVDVVAPGGAGPGGEARGVGDRAALSVTVQAASWIDATRLEVIVDGVTVETIALDATTEDPMNPVVRFRGTVEAPVADGPLGSWVVVAAAGDTPLEPVYGGRRPFGVTNPIFLYR